MAGTLVADTLQDGAGNSTSMDNAIYGSAKAWVSGSTGTTIQASYNVSSITANGTGDYTINFTNAFADNKYCPVFGALRQVDSVSFASVGVYNPSNNNSYMTTTSLRIVIQTYTGSNISAIPYVAIFR